MWILALIIIFGSSAFISFYMALMANSFNDDGVYLFAAFGLFFGIAFIAAVIEVLRKKGILFKWTEGKKSKEPEPTRFTPHWVMTTILIIFGIGFLAAIFIPRLLRGQ